MYCTNCGSQLTPDNPACPNCGFAPGVTPPSVPTALPPAIKPPDPVTTLVFSILVTVFCCMPFGVVGIVYSALAMSRHGAGDYATAQRFKNNAKIWTWIAFGIGLLGIFIWFVVAGLGALGAAGAAARNHP
jgi:hypothetical protein